MGDSVDNIPGAPGIGPKGAVDLVKKWGSTKNALDHAAEITHKTQRESLLNNRDQVLQSLELATVHCEVPVKLDLKAFEHCDPDRNKAYELFRELEFKALTNEFASSTGSFSTPTSGSGLFDDLPSHTGGDFPASVEARYETITTNAELDRIIRRLFEVQTGSFHVNDKSSNDKSSCYERVAPHGLGIGLGNGDAAYVDLDGWKED